MVRRLAAFVGSSFEIGLAASGGDLCHLRWAMAAKQLYGSRWCGECPDLERYYKAHAILNQLKNDWLGKIWLGCSVDRYMQIQSWDELMVWLNESDSHYNSDLGLFLRVGIEFGLDKFGQGIGKYIAFGTFLHKDKYNHPTIEERNDALICPGGFYDGKNYEVFGHLKIREHIKHSWYEDYPPAHPWNEGMPEPIESQHLHNTDFNTKYSWSKVPRYLDSNAEAGPLARAVMNVNPKNLPHQYQDPLFGNIMKKMGSGVFVRCIARMHEAIRLYTA